MKSIKDKETRKQKEKDINEKLGLFNLMGDKCLTCEKPFDRLKREDVENFYVVVKEAEKIVRVYCKVCFEKAQEIVKDFAKRVKDK